MQNKNESVFSLLKFFLTRIKHTNYKKVLMLIFEKKH